MTAAASTCPLVFRTALFQPGEAPNISHLLINPIRLLWLLFHYSLRYGVKIM